MPNLNENNIDEYLEKLKKKNSRYITQGVSFNKNCPRQMGLLRQALLSSASFSGLVKEMLALKFKDNTFDFEEFDDLEDIDL